MTRVYYVTSDEFTGLTTTSIEGPMSEDECDIEHVRSLIDEVGVEHQRDVTVMQRLVRKGFIKVILQVTPLGERKVRESVHES